MGAAADSAGAARKPVTPIEECAMAIVLHSADAVFGPEGLRLGMRMTCRVILDAGLDMSVTGSSGHASLATPWTTISISHTVDLFFNLLSNTSVALNGFYVDLGLSSCQG